jgi:hypothetical protein
VRKIVMRRQLHPAHPPAQIHGMRPVQQLVDPRVARLGGAIQRPGFCLAIGAPLVAYLQYRQQHALRIAQGDRAARLNLRRKGLADIEYHR